MEFLKNEFIEIFKGKQYLLVLDDVWNEDHKKWLELENLLKLGQRGSRILVTTRSEKTATIIENKLAYKLKSLSPNNSWKLFEKLAFDKEMPKHEDYSELVELGKKIVENCHNVPLAVEVIGNLLYDSDISKWRSFAERSLAEIGNVSDGIIPILKLSYNNLSNLLKSCFRYCALFPKDTEIEKQMLISLWMAQGYIEPIKGSSCQYLDLEDVAEEQFSILLQRSFFQDVKTDKYGNVMSVKIHDVMHDVAREASMSEICILSCNTSNVGDKIRHIHYIGERCQESFVYKRKLRTYIRDLKPLIYTDRLLEDYQIYQQKYQFRLQNKKIDSWMCLRVLDLANSDMEIVPDWIGMLLHLRYLNLSNNQGLLKLPDSITKLHNLQTLLLCYCERLSELPKYTSKLIKLRHLDLRGCHNLTDMPADMDKMTSLRVLPYFVVGKGYMEQCDGALKILQFFTALKGNLCIEIGDNYRHVDSMGENGQGYLKSTKYLTNLDISFDGYYKSRVEHEGIMEKLEPHSKLKRFILYGYAGKVIPKWGATQSNWAISLPHLVHIELGCSELEQLPSLSTLPYLKSLKLFSLDELEYMEDISNIATRSDEEDSTTFFPSLESLSIEKLEGLKGWWGGEHDVDGLIFIRRFFPRLSQLDIISCPNLLSFPRCPILQQLTLKNNNGNTVPMRINIWGNEDEPTGISHNKVTGLRKLVIDKMDYFNSIIVSNPMSRISEDYDIPQKYLNPSLESLAVCNFKDAHLSIPTNGVHYLASLHTLLILCCPGLDVLPEWIGNLSSLQSLIISECSGLQSLPESMKKLTSLQTLEIAYCSPELVKRCETPDSEEWTKVQHIPHFHIHKDY